MDTSPDPKGATPVAATLFVRLPIHLKKQLSDFTLRRRLLGPGAYQTVQEVVIALVGALTRAQLETGQPFDRDRARARFLHEFNRVFDDLYPAEVHDGGAPD